MESLFFDTETTDLRPGQIQQLAWIVTDDQCKVIEAHNHFFTVDQIAPTALEIHGLTLEKCRALSGGARFGDLGGSITASFSGRQLIAHNLEFDLLFLRTELGRLGLSLREGGQLCTMHYFTPICRLPSAKYGVKWPSGRELLEFLEIHPREVSRTARDLFGASGEAHDARYDTAAVYLCYSRGIERGYIDPPLPLFELL